MSKRDIRLWFNPDELRLIHDLVMVHVGQRIAHRELEAWEARLLAKLGRSYNKCAIMKPGGESSGHTEEAAPVG